MCEKNRYISYTSGGNVWENINGSKYLNAI